MTEEYDAALDGSGSYTVAIAAKKARGDKGYPAKWPADAVQRVSIKSLVPYPTNARTHSAGQIEQLAASIKQWGWTVPVLVDEKRGVIAGHGRLEAAKLLGLDTVPVMVAKGWSQKQIDAYRLADNQLALNSAWDVKLLAAELGGLADMADLIGFSDDELHKVLGSRKGKTDPDAVPPLPDVPVTKPGDVWQCGSHRLMCGDSTDAASVAKLLGSVKPNLMVTDPPYGVDYDASWRAAVNGDGPKSKRAVGKVLNDARADWHAAYALFPGNIAYVWHADRFASTAQRSLEAAKFTIRCQIIWAKQRHTFGRGDYHFQHEPCWYAVRKKGDWRGDRTQTTLWQIDNARNNETGHSTQKPVECMRRPILNNSSAGQAIYDPFVGSGTTMIAAEMEERQALCMELSPAYCDVAKTRWENFTGRKATLA